MTSRKRGNSSARSKEHSKKMRQLRSGKWTYEEEIFAHRLIEDFENGQLEDCEDGCTLRAYLAQKLRCAPMRISKKFAGRCIGKLVFVRRQRKPGTLSDGPTLKQLEHEFLCSVHVMDESFVAASTSSESGSDDGYEDHKQAYADGDVEYIIQPCAHARYVAPAQASFIHFHPQGGHFSHDFGSSVERPMMASAAPSAFSGSVMNRPTVAHQHPVVERAEFDPFPPLIDFAVSSDSSGLTLEDFVADLDYLEHVDFNTIF